MSAERQHTVRAPRGHAAGQVELCRPASRAKRGKRVVVRGGEVRLPRAERGFSPDEREQTPVIRSGGAVAAVYGIGTDALFLPGDGESVCVLTFEKTAE